MSDAVWNDACAAALAELPRIGPLTLSVLLSDRDPATVWATLTEGGALPDHWRGRVSQNDVWALWRSTSRRRDPLSVLSRYQDLSVTILHRYGEYPERLLVDDEAPSVLFALGDLALLEHPTAALVGTRRCTPSGRKIAREFGRELSRSGISVVSGLARGVDGEAHRGALELSWAIPPIGVVGSGLDVVYPAEHQSIWESVATRGLLLSEAPLGAPPRPWRFPARNRILAALSDVVVVVESRTKGGSLITAQEALDRGITVMTVPGSILSPTSMGTNDLIMDGAIPALSVLDVRAAVAAAYAEGVLTRQFGDELEFDPAGGVSRMAMDPSDSRGTDLLQLDLLHSDTRDSCGVLDSDSLHNDSLHSESDQPELWLHPESALPTIFPSPDVADLDVFEVLEIEPATTDEVIFRSGKPLDEVAVSLNRLEGMGLVEGEGGWWWRRCVEG